jgi:hypothetical protein
MDPDGTNRKLIFENNNEEGDIGNKVRLSPNQEFLAFFFNPRKQPQQPKLYIFDVRSETVRELPLKESFFINYNGGAIENVYWLTDNRTIVWRVQPMCIRKLVNHDQIQSSTSIQVIKTDTQSQQSSLLYSNSTSPGNWHRRYRLYAYRKNDLAAASQYRRMVVHHSTQIASERKTRISYAIIG